MDYKKEIHERDPIVRPDLKSSSASNLVFNEKVKTLLKSGREVAHFGFGQSPFPIPECLQEQLKNFAHINDYLPVKGIPELREAITIFHQQYDDLNLDANNIIVAPGSKELIAMIMNIFNGVILLTSPTWTTYAPQAQFVGKRPLILPTNKELGWKVTPEVLIEGLNYLNPQRKKGLKLLIITNPGNPTGTCYSEQELKDLGECCRSNDVFVLSDEIYARLTFNRKHASMYKYYPDGTILTSGYSKWASAGGWRLGYAYIPSSMSTLYNVLNSCASQMYSCAPGPMQFAVAKGLLEHNYELNEYMDDCTAILKLVSDYCHFELSSVGVTGHKSEAGYYFMPDFEVIRKGLAKKGITNGAQMTDAMLQEANVACMESETILRPGNELSVRFCFVCFDGAQALHSYKSYKRNGVKLEADNKEGQMFLNDNCSILINGVQRLKEWVNEYKNM